MFKIIQKEALSREIVSITVYAPKIAKNALAGQFAVLMIDDKGERVPLTLSDWDAQAGLIKLVFQKSGFTTRKLASLNVGDTILHVLGPLGRPSAIKAYGTVVCIGAGLGIAEVYPVSRAFKEAGNRVIGIIGSRSKELLILENQMQKLCDELFVSTDNGSAGTKGMVTDILKSLLLTIEKSTHTKYPDLIFAVGPVPMMKATALCTKDYSIKTIVSLNPIMVDATGICGSCRCTVEGKTVFGCVDGPDFDAHKIDFSELEQRLGLFKKQEEQINREKD